MKNLLNVLKGACSIAAAIVIYITVIRAVDGVPDILPYVIASVFAVSFAIALFLISSLMSRVETLERIILIDEEADEEEESGAKECPFCHALIDENAEICPYCRNEGRPEVGEYFATEDPDYRGTDFGDSEIISANTDIEDDVNFGGKNED